MRTIKFGLALALAVSALMATAAAAQQPVKIGFITTLSGPGGYIGADAATRCSLQSTWKVESSAASRSNSWSKTTV